MEEKGDGKAWRDTIAAGHLNRETPSDPTGHLFSEFLQSLFSSYLSCLLNDENVYFLHLACCQGIETNTLIQ